MKITFLLPCRTSFPSGGFKIIFEYANRFAEDGYDVTIVMPAILYTFKNKLAGIVRYPYYKITGNYTPHNWFELNKNIKCEYVWSLKEKNVPQSDIYIASAVETSYYLNEYKQSCKRFYFIQDFEVWDMNEAQVMKSYTFPLKKITISPWLQKKIEEAGSEAELIPNGFDFDYFHFFKPLTERNKYSILMMYHRDERKRCIDSINAIKIVKEKYPNLEVKMFGVPDRPSDIPFDFDYFQKPVREVHNELYNSASIFIAASKAEGMALPPAESMQCGCALCCTDIGGFAVYAKDKETAYLSKVYDVKHLAENIIFLIENDQERYRIAENGRKLISSFTWEKAYSKFKSIIEEF